MSIAFTTPFTCRACPHARDVHELRNRVTTKKVREGAEVWCPTCRNVCGDLVSTRVRYRKDVPRSTAVSLTEEWACR